MSQFPPPPPKAKFQAGDYAIWTGNTPKKYLKYQWQPAIVRGYKQMSQSTQSAIEMSDGVIISVNSASLKGPFKDEESAIKNSKLLQSGKKIDQNDIRGAFDLNQSLPEPTKKQSLVEREWIDTFIGFGCKLVQNPKPQRDNFEGKIMIPLVRDKHSILSFGRQYNKAGKFIGWYYTVIDSFDSTGFLIKNTKLGKLRMYELRLIYMGNPARLISHISGFTHTYKKIANMSMDEINNLSDEDVLDILCSDHNQSAEDKAWETDLVKVFIDFGCTLAHKSTPTLLRDSYDNFLVYAPLAVCRSGVFELGRYYTTRGLTGWLVKRLTDFCKPQIEEVYRGMYLPETYCKLGNSICIEITPGYKKFYQSLQQNAAAYKKFANKSIDEINNLSDDEVFDIGYKIIGNEEVDGVILPVITPALHDIPYALPQFNNPHYLRNFVFNGHLHFSGTDLTTVPVKINGTFYCGVDVKKIDGMPYAHLYSTPFSKEEIDIYHYKAQSLRGVSKDDDLGLEDLLGSI